MKLEVPKGAGGHVESSGGVGVELRGIGEGELRRRLLETKSRGWEREKGWRGTL